MSSNNLPLKIRQMPSTHRVMMIALLLIEIQNGNIHQQQLDVQQQTHRQVLNQVLRLVLQPLSIEQDPCAESGYYNVLCADGNFSRFKPGFTAWLANCPGFSERHHLRRHDCCRCECPKNERLDYVPPDKQHRRQDHNLHRILNNANTKAADAKLSSHNVDQGFKVFQHIPFIMSNLLKCERLHTMPIGMLVQLQKWSIRHLQTHKQLNQDNAIWISMPAYQDLTPSNQSYEEVSQWNGKKLKEMSWYLPAVVSQSLRGSSPAECLKCTCGIECTLGSLEFHMYARYESHKYPTMSYLDDALCHFHTFKDVFLLGRASKKAKAQANALRTELMKTRNVDKETNTETSTPSKKWCQMNAWRDYISHGIDVP